MSVNTFEDLLNHEIGDLLEENDVARLLSETYKQEVAADQLLTRVAEGVVNQAALEAGQ